MMVPAHEREENLKAVELGRQIAAYPDTFKRFTPRLPSFLEAFEDKTGLLERARGKTAAREYKKMVEEAARWMDLEDAVRTRMAQYVYDLIVFQDAAYAQRYLQRLWGVYKKDQKERGYAVTRAVMDNLYRMMIIKDEIYVAHLLTSEEKFRRDRERYRIDEARGDSAEYLHLNRPHFHLFGRDVEFDFKSRNWQLRILRSLRFVRDLIPKWHAEEKAFRDWYEQVVDGFHIFTDGEVYNLYLSALKSVDDVRGYYKVRYPKMDAARRNAEELLGKIQEKRAGSVPVRSGIKKA